MVGGELLEMWGEVGVDILEAGSLGGAGLRGADERDCINGVVILIYFRCVGDSRVCGGCACGGKMVTEVR